MNQLKIPNNFVKKSLSIFLLGAFSMQQGVFLLDTAFAATPIVNTTISVFKTGSEPFDISSTWDGSNLSTAGTDADEDNNVTRLQDSITYKVEVSVNDANVSELTSTVVLDKKQAWIEIPTGCETDLNLVTISSSISSDKRTLFCNLGAAVEGTNNIFFPTARAIGASVDGTEITLNDDRVNASVTAQADGTSNIATDSSEDTIVTANFKINTVKELINTATDPNTGALLYNAPIKTGASPTNRPGSIIEFVVKAQYVKGSMIANSDEITFEEDYQIIDIYTDDNSNNNTSGSGSDLSSGGTLYDWDPLIPACSLLGNHGPNASINCSQLNLALDNIGAGGTAPDSINDPNIQIDLQNIDVRDPDADGNLFEFQINLWFDKENDINSHQICATGGQCVNTIVNRVGVLNGTTVEGFNPISTEDAGLNNLLNYNGNGESFPNEEAYPLSTSTPGSYAAHIAFTNIFPYASQKFPDQDMAAGETRPYLMNVYDYRKIDGAKSQLCNKVDTQVFEYAGVAPPKQRPSPVLYGWNQNRDFNPIASIFEGSGPTKLVDGSSLVEFFFTNIEYVADPIANQAGYLDELRTAECNEDINGDGEINIVDTVGNESNPGNPIDWWMDSSMVPPIGGGLGNASNVTRVRQDSIYDATFANLQDPAHVKFAIAANHLITAKNIASSPYGSNNRLPHFMSHRTEGPDGSFGIWTHAGVTIGDPQADSNFSVTPRTADRMTLVPSSHSIAKRTEPSGIKVVRGGDTLDFIVEPKVYGLWSGTETARITDNLPDGTAYVNGSERFSVDHGTTWLTRQLYDASTPSVTITSPQHVLGDDLLRWDFGALESGDQLPLIKYSVYVDPELVSGTFLNVARITSDIGIDTNGNGSSNSQEAAYQLTILPEFGFDVLKVIGEKVYSTNLPFTFDLIYKNLGGEDYSAGEFIDIFPYTDDGLGTNTSGLGSSRTPSSTYSGSLTLTEINSSNGETFYGTSANPANIPQDPCHADNLPLGYIPLDGDLCYGTYSDNADTLPGGGTQGTGLISWNLCTTLTNPVTCGSIAAVDLTAIKFVTGTVTAVGGGQTVELEFTPQGNIGGAPDLDTEGKVTSVSMGDIYTNNFGGRIPEVSLIVISNDASVTVVSGSIGDTVWYDEDADGTQNGGELGLSNVTLQLLNASGVPIYVDPITGGIVDSSFTGGIPYTTTTDSDGNYLFENLPSGDYQVQVVANTLPNGMIQTYDSNGTGSLNISDHTLLQELDTFGNLADIEDNTDQDFGYTAYVDLEVNKLVDVDGDDTYTNFEIMNVPGINGNPDPTTFKYQITLENTSNLVEGTNVTLTDIIPPGIRVTASTMTPTNIASNESLPLTGAALTGTPISWDFPTVGTGTTTTIVLDAELTAANVSDFQAGFDSGKSSQNTVQVTAMDETDIDSVPNNGQDADFGGSTSGFNSSTSEDDENDARIGIPPAIGNYVWLDANNNGVQDTGEAGIEGVTVNLYDATDTIIATTTTNDDGGYFFTDLTDGVPYYVGFDHTSSAVENYNPSEQDNTTSPNASDTSDSDGDITTGLTDPYTLSPGEVYTGFDQGYVPIMSIGNRVFEDTNADGSMGADESGIANVTVELRDANGDPFSTPVTTTTDTDGYYLFTDLTPGDYTVFIPQQTAIENHLSSPGAPDPENGVDNDDNGGEVTPNRPEDGYITDVITLNANGEGEGETGGTGTQTDNANDANSNTTVDFGFFPPAAPTILKEFSVNTIAPNGISTLTLTLGNTNAFAITLSDDFTDTLPSGLEVAPTPNIVTTCPDTPTANTGSQMVTYANGSVLPAGGCSIMVDVTGDTDGDYTNLIGTGALMTNIGNSPESTTDDITIVSSSLGDTIWFDLNRDGYQDQTELDNPPAIINGLSVNLLDENGNVVRTTTTDSDGNYLFDGLTPGNYSVSVVLPNNLFLSTPQSDASNGDTNADSDFGSTATVTTSTMNTFTTPSVILGLGEDREDVDGGVYSSMPTVEKEFSVETIAPGSTSRLTLTLGNINVFALTLIADLTDTLPTGITVAAVPNIETTCPGTPVAASASTTVVYPTASIIPVGGCMIAVDVTGMVDGTYTNTIPAGALMTNIGNSPMATSDDLIIKSSSLGDTIWFDVNRDGVQDQEELDNPPVSVENLTVNLLDSNGIVIATTTTTSTGYYVFDDLLPGNYSVSLELPSTLYLSDPSRGDDENADSNFPTTATSTNTDGTKIFQTSSVSLGLAEDRTDIDGGIYFIAGTSSSSSTSSSGGGGGGGSSSSSSSSGGFTNTTTSTTTPTETTETPTQTTPKEQTETQETETVTEQQLPVVQEVEGPKQEVPTTYIPFPNQFAFPKLLPQTGTPLLERVSIIQNPKLNLDPPTWAKPDLEQSKTDIDYWKNVLPYAEDRSAEEYVVIPTLGVIVPISYVPQNSQDYQDIVKDGTQIKDFSLKGGTNYLEYLDQGVMQYPGTLPIALPAGENKEYTGNTVVFGHSSYWKDNAGKYDTVFGLLPTLDVGEEVWVFTRKNSDDGAYELRRHMIEKSYNTSATDTQILTQEGFSTPHLTLFTCTPIGGIAGRWIVQSKLIEAEQPEQTQAQQAAQIEKQKLQAAEDLKYGTNLSRVLRMKSKTMFSDLYERAGESNRERLTDFLLERLSTMNGKYDSDEKTMMYLQFLEEELMKMK